ncbi:DNA-directed RNA polymerase [Cloacibacillus porcorum]
MNKNQTLPVSLTELLNCAPENFPYSESELRALIEREQTIRTQWQLDLEDDWNSAMAKTKGGHSREGKIHGSNISEQQASRYLAVQYLPLAIEGVMALLNKLEAKTATRDKQYIELLASLPWLEFVAIAFTNMIDCAVKHDNVTTVIERIAGACETEARWRHYATHAESLFDRILEQQHKSGKNTEHITRVLTVAMDRLASGKYGDKVERPELVWENWPKGKDSFSRWLGQTYMDIICVTTGLFVQKNDTFKHDTPKRLHTSETFEEFISDTQARIGLYGGYYLPLPVPPRDWTTTQCGGFWTRVVGQKKLIKNWSKGYQEEMLNHSEELAKVVFPAINAAQHTAWRINWPVYEVLKELIEDGRPIAGLPSAEDLPLPVCPKCGKPVDADHPCFADPEQAKKDKLRAQLLKRKAKGEKINIEAEIEPNKNPYLRDWKADAAEVYRKNNSMKSRRLDLKYGLDVARILESDERFYYVYQTDFRGRLYPCGILHPQGTDWQKGILQFADGVELGEHGAKWLAVHLANTYGNDKVSFEDRVRWVQENEEWILECAYHPLDNTDKWAHKDVSEPFCFLAACFEWAGYKREGNSYKSHCAVALDGSCSGIQHYSAMLRDEVGAIATNVKRVPGTDGKNDIYGDVAKATLGLIERDVADAEVGEYATLVLAHKMIDRKTVKRAVMTLPYGSKFQSCSEYISAELLPKLAALGITERAQKTAITKYVAKRVWEAIPLVVQAAREGMSYLQRLANLFSTQALPITWQTPTGFYVQQSYYSVEGQRINIFSGGSIILKNGIPVWKNGEARERITFQSINARTINPTRQVSGIAPNFVHSLDASHLMFSVCAARKAGMNSFALIHDSLGTHAGKTEEFAKIIRDCFYRLYAENKPLETITRHLVEQLPSELQAKAPVMPKEGDLNLEDIKEALYLFA